MSSYPKLPEPEQPPAYTEEHNPTQKSWWLESWSYKFSSILAVALLVCGVITLISVTPGLILGGVLQILIALVILSIEAPSFVPCLSFLVPISGFLDSKPHWVKALLYAIFTLFPFIMCAITTGVSIGFFFILGAICNLAIFAIYCRMVLGIKAERDQMRAGAGGGGVYP